MRVYAALEGSFDRWLVGIFATPEAAMQALVPAAAPDSWSRQQDSDGLAHWGHGPTPYEAWVSEFEVVAAVGVDIEPVEALG